MHRNHPSHSYLYADFFPTVWCPGCGIGTVLFSFIEALKERGIDRRRVEAISGTGCSGKIAECLKMPSHTVTDGRVIEYALKTKQSHPDFLIAAFLNNADFLLSGAKGIMEAGRGRQNLLVVYINNFLYALSEDSHFPMTPFMRKSADYSHDLPFNIPHMADSVGAEYVARWTPMRAGWLKYSFLEAFQKKGLSVIEVISPCLIYNANTWKILDASERMQFYNDKTEIRNGEKTANLDLRSGDKIIIGKFVDREMEGGAE
jgi:2-oxoglutarate ferredoxin oxidoreductase subunit beta